MSSHRRNVLILIFIIILDFMGFTLIFPLVPDMLLYYVEYPYYYTDTIIINFFYFIDSSVKQLFILESSQQKDIVVIIGGILSSLYSILQFLFSPYWGKLSDEIGRKKVLVITSAGLSISYLIWFFSKSFTFFILSRVLGGVMAGNLGVASASMSDLSNEKNRTAYMGLVGMAFGLGFILGPVFGGIVYYFSKNISQTISFLHPFSICAFASFLLSLMSVFLTLFFYQETNKNFINKEVILKRKLKPLNTSIRILIIMNLIYMLVFTSYEFTFTFFYKFTFHLLPEQIGIVFLFLGILIAFGQGFLSRIVSKKIKEIQMIRLGVFLIPITFLLQPLIKENIFISVITLIPLALGNSLFQPAINSLASILSDKNEQGYILGLMRSFGSLSRAIGPILGGTLYWLIGVQWTYLIFSLIIFMLILLTFKL